MPQPGPDVLLGLHTWCYQTVPLASTDIFYTDASNSEVDSSSAAKMYAAFDVQPFPSWHVQLLMTTIRACQAGSPKLLTQQAPSLILLEGCKRLGPGLLHNKAYSTTWRACMLCAVPNRLHSTSIVPCISNKTEQTRRESSQQKVILLQGCAGMRMQKHAAQAYHAQAC